jgi:membrane protease YdiL (CAAX protease family)
MSATAGASPGFFRIVWILLGIARRRAAGRLRRQQQLLNQRAGKRAMNWGVLGFAVAILFMAMINALGASFVDFAVASGTRVEAQQRGKIVVLPWFYAKLRQAQEHSDDPVSLDRAMARYYRSEAVNTAREYGGDADALQMQVHSAVLNGGTARFVTVRTVGPALRALPRRGGIPNMMGSLALLWWSLMLICQGEGLELDIQRRRHPMWEWLFSHPVPAGAVFLAEMLSPIAANPIYYSAPLFAGVLYGLVYGTTLGITAGLLIGVPITLAAACVGKALEIGIMLRVAPRSRGAMIGLLGWFGYASMAAMVMCIAVINKMFVGLAGLLAPLATVPWPFLGWFLGVTPDGGFSFWRGMLTCGAGVAVTTGTAVAFSSWAAKSGLTNAQGDVKPAGRRPSGSQSGFGKNALYRKELLWFARDRSALVQAVLIPLSLAGYQAFNLRFFLAKAPTAWNYLSGAAIIFGTYFLSVLGPKSLASEGAALWIALTWPQGMETLLKAKAWLWSAISSAIVGVVLCYAAFMFPQNAWKILLVAVGWYLFARSMAEKGVTLATVTLPSGEPEKVPAGRRYAAQLGTLPFAVGVLTEQWPLAVTGVVYSTLTAAAMWQNFRARLPYLYDPWSEKLPPAPSLMHAMIGISLLVEVGAVLLGLLAAVLGSDKIAVAQALVYGACAFTVSLLMANFLRGRGVTLRDVWLWPPAARPGKRALLLALGFGVLAGAILGLCAHLYETLVQLIPAAQEIQARAQAQMSAIPHIRESYFVMAVLIAPVAEEYLFRGLLYRALEREWGGWRAVLGSAAFFASYHPVLSWLPVFCLGALNAVLFKRSGRLAPAVLLHMTYNAVVLA